jgi:predicted porin
LNIKSEEIIQMQKKLIALAVAAAFSAPAFADVTMYGSVDAAVAHASADGQKSDTLAVSGGMSPSRLGVNSSEDLGDGLKAVVNIEYGLDAQTNSTIGTSGTATTVRQQLLGLAGSFGTVATGYLQTTGYDFAMKYDPTAESLVDPLQNVVGQNFLIGSNAIASRAQRALAYISPSMSGVTVAVNYSTALAGLGQLTQASNANSGKTTATLVSVNYDGGPLSVGAVYAADSTFNGAGELKDYSLGASYDFKVVKLLATYQSSTPTGMSANKAESVSAVAPVGPGAVALSYAKNTMNSIGGVTCNSCGATSYTLAYLQGLSKTTTAYAAVSRVSQDAGTNAFSVINDALGGGFMSAGGSSTLLAVGLNKKF